MGACASREYRRTHDISVKLRGRVFKDGAEVAPETVLRLEAIDISDVPSNPSKQSLYDRLALARNDALVLAMYNNDDALQQPARRMELERMEQHYTKFRDAEVEKIEDLVADPTKVSPRPCMVLLNNVRGYPVSEFVPVGYIAVVNTFPNQNDWGIGIWFTEAQREGDRLSVLVGALASWAYIESCREIGVEAIFKDIVFETKTYNMKMHNAVVDFIAMADVLGVKLTTDDVSVTLPCAEAAASGHELAVPPCNKLHFHIKPTAAKRIATELHRVVADTKTDPRRCLTLNSTGQISLEKRKVILDAFFPAAFVPQYCFRVDAKRSFQQMVTIWRGAGEKGPFPSSTRECDELNALPEAQALPVTFEFLTAHNRGGMATTPPTTDFPAPYRHTVFMYRATKKVKPAVPTSAAAVDPSLDVNSCVFFEVVAAQ